MEELDFDFIEEKMREVLRNAHGDSRKHNIKNFDDRINFSCPICGDSVKDPSKKRANIYKDNPLFMVCFNEGCRASVTNLFNTFNVQISPEKKQQMYNYADSHIKFTNKKDIYIPENLDKMIDLNELSNYLNSHIEHKIQNFQPIQINSAAYQYLKFDRLISNFENIYEADYIITDKWKEKVIVILNRAGDKLLGMQIRNLKSGDKRLFKIYNFESLYNILHPNEEIDKLELLSYNKISNFYNIMNVNWDQTVTIFEGYLDSLFCKLISSPPNSIGAIGLNSIDTDLNFLFDAGLDIQFFLDQDYDGIKNSINLLKSGNSVFLWQKFNRDILKIKKGSVDSIEAAKAILKIKDLNRLVQTFKNTDIYDKLKLNNYFSNNKTDIYYLDITKYPKNETKKYNKNK